MRISILLASSAAAGLAATAFAARVPVDSQRTDLCRTAPALPQLGLERDRFDQQQYPRAVAPPPPSPPPPPPPAPAPERGSDDRVSSPVAVTGTRSAIERDDAGTAPPPPPPAAATSERARREVGKSMPAPVPPSYRHDPPAGLLTAGDHDDLLNPRLYARYAWRAARGLGQWISGLPRVDTSRVLTVTVEDRNGRPAPFVPVTVRCANGASLTYSTLADGKVTLFPDLDRLGSHVTLSAGGSRRQVVIEGTAGGQSQTLVTRAGALAPRKLDLMIALDSTGSMSDEIAYLKSELRSIVDELSRQYGGLDIRVGLVSYRDEGDEYVTRTLPLTGRFDTIQERLDRTRGEGGGDMPEAMDQALIRATDQAWRGDAVKVMLLVADAPPHDELQGRAFAAAEAARARRIQIVPVAASGVDDRAEYFMRAVAALTQSRYIFLTDDSGIGNAHAEPDVDCYVVTRLATSIRRVLASLVSGQRIEPYPHEVIRTVGQYDNGKCVLPRNFDPRQ